MMEMVNGSRLSNAMRAAGLMRRGLLESLVHARQRVAFGHPLIELPLLRSNLLSMLLDAEARRLGHPERRRAARPRATRASAEARALARVWTPLAKYWITLRARDVTAEAMNVRGGNGYVEEWVNPRLLRDAYLGAIWEGSANVVALDVQRAILKDRGLEALAAFVGERLGRVAEPAAKPLVDLAPRDPGGGRAPDRGLGRAARRGARAGRAAGGRHALPPAGRARCCWPRARPCASRGGASGSCSSAGLYLKRWLEPRGPASPPFTARQVEWLEPLAEWRPIDGVGAGRPGGLRGAMSTDEIVWRPDPEAAARTRMGRFMARARHRHAGRAAAALGRGARVVLGRGGRAIWASTGSRPYRRVLDDSKRHRVAALVRGRPAEPRRQLRGSPHRGRARRQARGHLRRPRTARCARSPTASWRARWTGWPTRSSGSASARATRVGIFLPMSPEAAIATLAVVRIGAIYTPCFSGYGAQAVASRLRRLRGASC